MKEKEILINYLTENLIIKANSYSYTIITAHIKKKRGK